MAQLKTILLTTIVAFVLTITSFSQTKKDTNRYFQVSYFGQDTIGRIKYGSYFFSTTNKGFVSIEQAKAIVIAGYHLSFTPFDDRLAIWITEFNNKTEWLKWNGQHKSKKNN